MPNTRASATPTPSQHPSPRRALHQELQWQRNDVRIFAHAAAETQVAIKDALAHKFNTARSGAADSIAAGVNDPGFLEVFPRVASRPPKLLQELEAILVDRLRANDKAASMTVLGSARERDPKLSANLSLDGHRQVCVGFAFLHEGMGLDGADTGGRAKRVGTGLCTTERALLRPLAPSARRLASLLSRFLLPPAGDVGLHRGLLHLRAAAQPHPGRVRPSAERGRAQRTGAAEGRAIGWWVRRGGRGRGGGRV